MRCEGRHVTYRDLAELTNPVGSGLRDLGVELEQRVLLVLPDVPEFAAAYLGTMKIGAVAVPTSTALRAPDFAFALEQSRARGVIVHQAAWPEMALALATVRRVASGGQPRADIVIRTQPGVSGRFVARALPGVESAPVVGGGVTGHR